MSETETRGADFTANASLAMIAAAHDNLMRQRNEARAELSRLRDVVEAVQAVADRWQARHLAYAGEVIEDLRAALAPVSSSGEAESGHTLTEHGTTDCPVEHRGHVEYRDKTPGFVDDIPTPVSSGGQEDGEGEPKLFRLVRDRDVSGVSGTGLVAWGVRFPDGRVATRWHAEIAQTCTWDSIEHVEAIHGHGGATRVEWLAARPVLSRDALRAAILSARDSSGNLVEYLSSTTAEYVADAILAGGEQA